jgi:hypothetical protein
MDSISDSYIICKVLISIDKADNCVRSYSSSNISGYENNINTYNTFDQALTRQRSYTESVMAWPLLFLTNFPLMINATIDVPTKVADQ